MRRTARFIAALLVFLAGAAHAQLTIEITGGGANQIPIAVLPFAGESALPRFLAIFADLSKTQGERWAAALAKEETGLSALPGLEIDLEELRRDVPALLDALEKP